MGHFQKTFNGQHILTSHATFQVEGVFQKLFWTITFAFVALLFTNNCRSHITHYWVTWKIKWLTTQYLASKRKWNHG